MSGGIVSSDLLFKDGVPTLDIKFSNAKCVIAIDPTNPPMSKLIDITASNDPIVSIDELKTETPTKEIPLVIETPVVSKVSTLDK